jgi:hypothetical protein
MRFKAALSIFAVALLSLTIIPSRAADTLPERLTDEAYWKLITDLSETPPGVYPDVFTGNEPAYQEMLPELTKAVAPGGTYIGVGPEQNFTYVAALRPKIAFVIDIRRDQMLQHLMYKALFEMSTDRTDFVGKLFSRKRPAPLTADSPVQEIFRAYAAVPADAELTEGSLKEILSSLKTKHRFALTENDERRIRFIHVAFAREGVVTFRASQESPGYTRNMTSTDKAGKNWSYLASNENFNLVRGMFDKNLIVPLVGDFTGPKTIRMTGQYIRDHGAVVNVFYVSNVEDYIQPAWKTYAGNIASLPLGPSSTFIRWTIGSRPPWLGSINEFVGMHGPKP